MARARGWPVGETLDEDVSIPKIFAFVAAPWVLVKAFIVFYWWSRVLVIVLGWALAFLVTMLLKKHTHVLCVLGIIPAFVFAVLYHSEQNPFASISLIFEALGLPPNP